MLRAQHPVQAVARPLRHPGRGDVVGVDPQLDPLEPELVEAPAGQEGDGAARDALAAGLGGHEVADLALCARVVEAEDAGEADDRTVPAQDREAGAASLRPPTLVAGDPVGREVPVGAGRDHGEPADVVLEHERLEDGHVPLRKRLERDRVVRERRVRRGQRHG